MYDDTRRFGICTHCGQALRDDRVAVTDHRGTRRIPVPEIVVLRAIDKVVEVWTRKGLNGCTFESLVSIERANPDRWMRVHRKLLVDAAAIERVSSVHAPGGTLHAAHIEGFPEPVPISRREWSRIRPLLKRRLT